MKRLSITLLALGLSATAFAALPAATDPNLVAVPSLPGGLVLGVTGYYIQPTDSNGDLDYANVNTFSGANSFSSIKNVEPGYNWAWGANIGYVFPNTGNDVNLSYFQLDSNDTASTSNSGLNGVASLASNVSFPFALSGSLNPSYANAAVAKAEYDLNQVDLTAGQSFDIGCRLIAHPYAGVRWADLQRKLNTTFTNSSSFGSSTTLTQTQTAAFAEKSTYQGIGPIAGLDASYYVGYGFGVVGHMDGALLVGSINSSTDETLKQVLTASNGISSVINSVSGAANFSAGSTQRVVPVLDMKLGADYTWVFNDASNSDLTLEAGWMVSDYIDAVDRLQTVTTTQNSFSANPFLAPIAGAAVAGRSTSDVALNGPYVSLVAHI